MEEKYKKDGDWKLTGIAIFLFLFVVIVWASAWALLQGYKNGPDGPGTFGDMFGSVNALFSGWAFAGVIYAILLQRKELELQRSELEATRKEFQIQNETLERQRFENTFFNLLKSHNDLLEAINVPSIKSQAPDVGRDAFSTMYQWLQFSYKQARNNPSNTGIGTPLEQAYHDFYKDHKASVGHYFRHLCEIFKFVDSSSIDNKKEYFGFVIASISMQEMALIFYHVVCNAEGRELKGIIEKWGFFSGIDRSIFLDPHNDHLLIDSTAYGNVSFQSWN